MPKAMLTYLIYTLEFNIKTPGEQKPSNSSMYIIIKLQSTDSNEFQQS